MDDRSLVVAPNPRTAVGLAYEVPRRMVSLEVYDAAGAASGPGGPEHRTASTGSYGSNRPGRPGGSAGTYYIRYPNR